VFIDTPVKKYDAEHSLYPYSSQNATLMKGINEMISKLHVFDEKKDDSIQDGVQADVDDSGPAEPFQDVPAESRNTLSAEQKEVVRLMCDTDGQKLVFMHGGGGCGKSTAIKFIHREVERKGKRAICCCPTGAGAMLLPGGRTVHSLFNFNAKVLSSDASTKKIESTLGGDKLEVLIIDEV